MNTTTILIGAAAAYFLFGNKTSLLTNSTQGDYSPAGDPNTDPNNGSGWDENPGTNTPAFSRDTTGPYILFDDGKDIYAIRYVVGYSKIQDYVPEEVVRKLNQYYAMNYLELQGVAQQFSADEYEGNREKDLLNLAAYLKNMPPIFKTRAIWMHDVPDHEHASNSPHYDYQGAGLKALWDPTIGKFKTYLYQPVNWSNWIQHLEQKESQSSGLPDNVQPSSDSTGGTVQVTSEGEVYAPSNFSTATVGKKRSYLA